MTDFFKIDGLTFELDPTISKWGYGDLEDNPETHRWRASWESSSGGDPLIYGIILTAHPVIKRTRCGVWINCDGSRQSTKQPWEEGAPALEWVPFDERWMRKRFVNDGSGQAWAKPTQEEALRSIAIRMCRWAQRAHHDMQRLQAAIAVLESLRPDWPAYPEAARAHLRGEYR